MKEEKRPAVRRTLVEFFDREYLENIVSLLYESYHGVVFACFRGTNMPDARERTLLERFIREKFGIGVSFLEVGEHSMEAALDCFERLIAVDGFYEFDITGGSSVFIAAAGALLERDGGRRMAIHEYDTARGQVTFQVPADSPIPLRERPERLTVSDVMGVQGIEIVDPKSPIRYDLDRDGLREEILRLWDTVRGDLRAWNTLSTVPTESVAAWGWMQVVKEMTDRQLTATKTLLSKMEKAGIISHLEQREDGNRVAVSYHLHIPESAWFVYDKGGSLLEILTYLVAVDSGEFADCCTGIKLDWEHGAEKPCANPFNELDVVMTRGHIPCLVSCKNASVENDFLYEIMTMTRHFGGKYAIPMLVTTMECGTALRARAKEMGVVLIDNIRELTAERYGKLLCSKLMKR